MTDEHERGVVERAAVVAWLRKDAARTRQGLSHMHMRKLLTPDQTEQWETLISLKAGIADAIERGDHHRPTP